MESPSYIPTLWNMGGKTLALLQERKAILWKTAILLFFLPLFLAEWGLAIYGRSAGAHITEAASLQEFAPTAQGYLPLLEAFYGFMGPAFALTLLQGLLLLAGYLSVVAVCMARYTDPSRHAPVSAWLGQGFRWLLPKGIPFVLVLLLTSFEQVAFPSLHILSAFALITVPIHLHKKEGMFASMAHALFLRYTGPQRGGALRVAFILILTMALASACHMSLEILCLKAPFVSLAFDPHDYLHLSVPGTPFTLVSLLLQLLRALGISFLLTWLAAFSVSLYFEVSPTLSERLRK